MRKLLAGAAFLVLGGGTASTASAQVMQMKGSDTLEEITKDIIVACSAGHLAGALGSPSPINYVGGGSGGGESAMSGTAVQQIAPMSRQLNSGNGALCSATTGNELLIGLDGIAVVAADQLALDSTTSACGDAIVGGKVVSIADCSLPGAFCDGGVVSGPGTYTFADWKDVLAVVYGGQNHIPNATTAQLTAGKTRNPARINCAGALRQTVLNNWGNIFTSDGVQPDCRTSTCVRLKHAFRRDDVSGTSDTFTSLVGLFTIPAYSKTNAANFPTVDLSSATANPFCNAGEALMNKGDSDYLDLDPIRRIADSEGVQPNNRLAHEQVAEGYNAPSNPPASPAADNGMGGRTDPAGAGLADFGASNRQNVGPDPNNATWFASQAAVLPNRRGLGVVIPISMPTNFSDEPTAYWSPTPGAPVLCDAGVLAPSLPSSPPQGICPDGQAPPCNFPVHVNPDGTVNFNCMSPSPVPAPLPLRDVRVYNLLVLNSAGKYVLDNYSNGNESLVAVRQQRVVSAFYRLHTTQVDDFQGMHTGGPCRTFDATAQIGCLVQASPCSVGYAGREAVSLANHSLAARLGNPASPTIAANAIACNQPNIEHLNNLDGLGLTAYPMARRLWVNAVKGLKAVTNSFTIPPSTTAFNFNELELLKCFGYDPSNTAGTNGGPNGGNQPTGQISNGTDAIDDVVVNHHFIDVPDSHGTKPGTTRVKDCGLPP